MHQFLFDSYLADKKGIEKKRNSLGDMSDFMKLLKQPISYQSNKEDGCTGSFFSKRFYSGAILDDEGVLAAMAYVDLNPVRAKISRSLEKSNYTSVHERVQVSSAEALDA